MAITDEQKDKIKLAMYMKQPKKKLAEMLVDCNNVFSKQNIASENLVQAPVMLSGWQACPKCNGQGTVQKPPQVCGDVDHWISDATQYECNVCNGKKIISTVTGCSPASH